MAATTVWSPMRLPKSNGTYLGIANIDETFSDKEL